MTDAPADEIDSRRPLARFGGARPPAAPWMVESLAHVPEVLSVDVQGASIEVLRWGEADLPGLLFVHGGVAHAHWWDHVAPFFRQTHRCAAISLSGMGGSGWREGYGMDLYAEELRAAADVAGLLRGGRGPILVGHSFGGLVSVRALELMPDIFPAGIIVDSPSLRPGVGLPQPVRGNAHTTRASLEEMVGRFRLMPAEVPGEPFLLDHIARTGAVERDGGWQWAFDPAMSQKTPADEGRPDFSAVADRVAFVRGEGSIVVGEDGAARVREALGPDAPFIEIPGGGHHVLLNRPLAFIATLRAILQCWPPARRS